MLSSITPLGERGRRARWPVTVTSYLIGSTLAGLAVGGLLGWLGGLVLSGLPERSAVPFAVLAVLALAGAAADTTRWRHLLPTVHRQVNEDWLDLYRSWVYGLGFGAQLGTGVVTIVTTAAVYLLWATALVGHDPLLGALLGATFGLARALPVLRARGVVSSDRLAELFRAVAAGEGRARRTAIAAQATVGVALAGLVTLGATVGTV